MKHKIHWMFMTTLAVLLLGMALIQPGIALAQGDPPVTVTIKVNTSENSPLDGVTISYLDGYWRNLGNTDSNGQVSLSLPPGSWEFKASYGGTSATQTQDVSNNPLVTFYTSAARVSVYESDSSTPLPGTAVSYYAGYDRGFGTTDENGVATTQLFPGAYDFKASYGGTSASQSMTVPGDSLSAGQQAAITFYTSEAQVEVFESDGSTPLPGTAVSYYAGYDRGFGTTDDLGKATTQLFPGTYDFKASYGGTSVVQSTTVPGDGLSAQKQATITFYTSEARVFVKDCDGTPVPGSTVSYFAGYDRNIGNTDANGAVAAQLFPGTYDFKAAYGGTTSALESMAVPGDGATSGQSVEKTFNPTKVTLAYSGRTYYLAGYWRGFSGTIYMFPGTYTFKFDDIQKEITVDGCELSNSVLVIKLKDSAGAGVPGGKAYKGVSGWPYIGDTDANGVLVYLSDGALGNMRIRMDAPFYGGSQDSPVQDTAVNSVFNFQTSQVVIQLRDSTGNLVDGGSVQAGDGGWPVIGVTGANGPGTLYHEHFSGDFKYRMSFNGTTAEQQHDVGLPFVFQTLQAVIQLQDHLGNPLDGGSVQFGIGGWPVIGTTGDGGTGRVTRELFAGTYSFRMSYNYGTEEKQQDISTPVVFQTSLVSLQFGGTIQHGVGGWPAYSGPTEMLPVEHRFGFTAPGLTKEELSFTPIAGTVFERTIVYLKLLDSAGNGLAGGMASYYLSGWQNIPDPTDADGKLLYAIPGLTKSYSIRMNWAGYTQQQSNVNVTLPANTPVIFQTVNMVVSLKDSGGAPLADGDVQYYASGWKPFGTTDVTGNTGAVELLPGTYSFRLSYKGYTQQQSNVNIVTTNPLMFQTVQMLVHLKDSKGIPLAGGVVQYYASGWKPFGTTDGTGNTEAVELLPGTYSFKLSYQGYTQQKSNVNIALAANVPLEFQTISMVVRLEEKTDQSGIGGGVVQYYASGWKSFGTTDGAGNTPAVELLPGTYSFKMAYAGATEQKSNVDITQPDNNPLVFQTVNEVMSVELRNSGGTGIPGGEAQYYASGWNPFGTTDGNGVAVGPNLLPGTYSFRMTYAGYTQQKSNIDITLPENKPLIFETQEMVVQLKDSKDNPIQGGVVQYYASGWKDFGTTDSNGEASLELQPGTYSFRMSYEGYTQQKSNVDISNENPLEFKTVLMEVQLKDSNGAPLSEGAVQYYASGWQAFGDTGTDGSVTKELLPGTYSFRMTYAGYTQQKSNIDITGENPLVFQTVPMVVRLQTCTGAGLEGGAVQYYASGWKPFGETGGDGEATLQLLPGTYSFRLTWEGQTEQRSNIDLNTNNPLIYQTTQVALQYPEDIKYYASGWRSFTSPMELLPYNYTFKFGSFQTHVEVSGCALNKSVAVLVLKDHLGKGLSGGTARGGNGASYSGWFVPGTTDANGILFDYRDGSAATMSYEMRYNNTTQIVTQDVTANAVFEFQTDLATMRLQNCAGTGLSGGTVRYGAGNTYTTWFFPGGATDENGETSAEFFPGTYSFEMGFQGTSEAKVGMALPTGSPLVWTTTKVTLQYGGQISYGGPAGQSAWFNKPSMEFLPGGTYTFHFQNPEGGRLDLSWSGCEFTQSVAALKLINSAGIGISGATGQYYDGGWKDIPGSTDENGLLTFLVPGLKGNMPFAMNYAYARQEKSQNIASDSIVVFQTQNVAVELRDHEGELDKLPEEGAVQYYAGGWHDIGTTIDGAVSIELLPLNYAFSMDYAYARQEKSQNVGTDPTVTFQTQLSEVQLQDHEGNQGLLPDEGTAQYYAGGWHDIGQTSNGTVSIELLPLNYPFSMNYAYARQEKSQNVDADSTVIFQTQNVTVELRDSQGGLLGDGDTAQYYAGGWHDIGQTSNGTVSIELLPLNYPFSMNYAYARQEKSQNVGGSPLVTFQTGKVHAGNTTIVEYYAGGWQAFTDDMELLPGTYPFRYPTLSGTVVAGQTLELFP